MSKFGFTATAAAFVLFAALSAQAQVPKQDSNSGTGAKAVPHFFIDGAVARPGMYHFKPGYRLSDALSDAFGPTPQADLSIIMLSHAGKPQNTPQMIWVNFNSFVLRGKTTGNPLLQPGDDIYVLGKKGRHALIAVDPAQPHLVY